MSPLPTAPAQKTPCPPSSLPSAVPRTFLTFGLAG
jgi:hypothetical protein